MIYCRGNKGDEMEDLVFSKRHIAYCNMCYTGCQWCNYGMVTAEHKEKLDREHKERLEKERRKNEK